MCALSSREERDVTSRVPAGSASIAPIVVALLFGVLDGAMIVVSDQPSWSVEIQASAYALGYELLIGGAVLLVGLLAQRASRWQFGGATVVVLASLGFGVLVLPEELRVRAEKLAPGGGVLPVWILLIGAFSLFPTAAVLVGGWAARLQIGLLAPAGALVAQFVNHRVLSGHYPGIHLLVTVFAFLLASSSLWTRFSVGVAGARFWYGFGWLAALTSLAFEPRPRVLLELLRHSGVSVAPQLAAVRTAIRHRRESAPRSNHPNAVRPRTEPGLGRSDFLVLLLSVDSMRADVLPAYRDALPNLASFAESAVRFENARSTANATYVALTSLMTSRYYSQQYWEPREPGGPPLPLRDTSLHFSEVLKAARISTLLVDNAGWMEAELGLTRGFQEQVPAARGAEGFAYADEVARALRDRISSAVQRPAFLFAHFLDAHAPYDRGGSEGNAKARYVRELAEVDRAIGSILEHLVRADVHEHTIVVVTADHGEAFGEHGGFQHGGSVYEEVVRIPLWIRAPGLSARSIDVPVSLVDLAPTIVDVFGLDVPGAFMGETLVPILVGATALPPRPIVVDTGRRRQAMIFPNGLKVSRDLHFGLIELYDLNSDAGERLSLYDSVVSSSPELDALAHFFDVHTRRENGYVPPFRNP